MKMKSIDLALSKCVSSTASWSSTRRSCSDISPRTIFASHKKNLVDELKCVLAELARCLPNMKAQLPKMLLGVPDAVQAAYGVTVEAKQLAADVAAIARAPPRELPKDDDPSRRLV
jgi:hypothetical protein